MTEDLWSAQDTTPAAIEAALRELEMQRAAEYPGYVPARVLNLVAIVDRDWRGEIANRLDRIGRYHASRTVLCAVERGRTRLDARAALSYDVDPTPGSLAVTRERVEIDIGPGHLRGLDTIVDALLIAGCLTVVWSPHGYREAVDALLGRAHVVLLDSVEEPELHSALTWVAELSRRAYVVDLAWLRSTPWRERVCATFDPPEWRDELGRISRLEVRHQPESAAAALLFCGWLSSRLGWSPAALLPRNGGFAGKARARRGDVAVELTATPAQGVPGLAGVTIETANGVSMSLDRGPGGLSARRRDRLGRESTWTILGASRGEGGILGEGVRQALLRDPTYAPALEAARAMLP